MPSEDPALWPAHRQAAAIADRRLSSRELLDAVAARIARLNPTVNAVVTLDLDRGYAAAAACDRETARGERRGPLHGLPVTVKDALAVRGLRSTGGASELADHVPDQDADAVARIHAAGAFCFGKTNVPRWSGDAQTTNELFGTTNNPWDLGRGPGGSSGGAAVAVSLGMTAFEIGTDIGGSIRIPSAFCGVAGHKPSYGLVPCGGYLDHLNGGTTEPDINAAGPIARAEDDLDLLLGVLAGPRPDRAMAWRVELPEPRADRIDGLRVAVWSDDPACPVSADTRAAVEHVAAVLRSAGARVDPTARPALDAAAAVRLGMGLVFAATSQAQTDAGFEKARSFAARAGAGEPNPFAVMTGSHRDWLAYDRARTALRARWADFYRGIDVLVCPAVARPAFPHLHSKSLAGRTITIDGVERPYVDLMWWTVLVGMAYLPSTVVPVTTSADGLPIGVQLVGPFLEDRTPIAAARALRRELGPLRLPSLAG